MKHVEKIELMSIHYRVMHMINLVLFTILALTGALIMYSDDYAILQTMLKPLGEPVAVFMGLDPDEYAVSSALLLIRIVHRITAFIWGVLVVVYILVLLLTRNIRVFDGLFRSPSIVIAEAKAVILHYVAGAPIPEEVEARMERHNALVGLAVILLVIGAGLLAVSGTAMVLLDLTPEQYRLFLTLHDIGFYLAMTFLIAHLFATLHPGNLPLLKAMFGDGKVSLEYAEKHMRAYLKKIGAI
ncbi:MAG: cytochrome b/b6 domain-containing protein [Acidilobaceae archaeon]